MKRERITYSGAYHHVMNRGYDGNDIFAGNKNKSHYPVRAGIVQHAASYIWSSVQYYFSNQKTEIVDAEYVNQLFGSRQQLFAGYDSEANSVLPVRRTKHGEVLGSDAFMERARKRHNRREIPTEQSIGTQRKDDRFFEPIEKVFREFKNIYGVDGDSIDTTTWEGKRLRGELPVLLKERAGLKYREIGEFNAFGDLSTWGRVSTLDISAALMILTDT